MSTFNEGTPIPIKELLIEATFAPNRALRAGVEAIDLGVLGEEAERICDKALFASDQRNRVEYSLPALVTRNKKLLLRTEEFKGSEMRVESNFTIMVHRLYESLPREERGFFPKVLRQNFFIAANIHNHVIDVPPSPQDCSRLFLEDIDVESETAVFVATLKDKFLFLRGGSTPMWDMEKTNLFIDSWRASIRNLTSQISLNGFVNSAEEASLKAQIYMLREIISEYDLQAFSCPLRENIARRIIF